MKKGALKNFDKFTGKHLCQSQFFNKVAGLRPARLLKSVFSCEFSEISKNTFFTEQLWETASDMVQNGLTCESIRLSLILFSSFT